MQYGHDLQCLIREVVISDPALGLVHILKSDVSDDFYRIGLLPTDVPNMGIFSPPEVEDNNLVAIPLTIHIGWKNSPPIFCTATETAVDLENADLCCNTSALPHRLDYIYEAIVREETPTLHLALAGLTRDP